MSLVYRFLPVLVCCLVSILSNAQVVDRPVFYADNKFIQYTGRIDLTNPKAPRFWQPGVYVSFRVRGKYCKIILRDEELWGKNHNYIEVVVNDRPKRWQTKAKENEIELDSLSANTNTIVICKNTEARS